MRNYTLVAAAVAAALGSASSFADTTLVVAGSSAFRNAFANNLQTSTTLCAAGTFQSFVAVAGAGVGQLPSPDFRAYTCTAGSALPGLGTLTIYYRSEGGSAIGLISNHTLAGGGGLLLNQLNPAVAGLVVNETEAQLLADTQTGAVQKLQVQLGILDAEPTAFLGANWPGQFSVIPYAAPSRSKLATVASNKSIIGQVFAPIVSKTWVTGGGNSGFFSATGVNNTAGLTSAEIGAITSGTVTDWGKIPSAVAAGAPAGTPIVVCRRDAGSGTQVMTSQYFLNYNCSNSGLPYANPTGTGPNNPTPGSAAVLTNYSTTDVINCVKNNPGAIGFVALQPAATYTGANATQVTVDGLVPSAINAASGAYRYYGEAYAVKDSSLTGNSLTLANAILADLANRANIPTNASVPSLVAVPSSTNAAVSPPVLGPGGTPPIAVGTTGGNSCTPFTVNKL